MKYEVKVQGKKYEVEVEEVSPMVFEVTVNGKKAVIEVEKKLEVAEFEKAEIKERRFAEARAERRRKNLSQERQSQHQWQVLLRRFSRRVERRLRLEKLC